MQHSPTLAAVQPAGLELGNAGDKVFEEINGMPGAGLQHGQGVRRLVGQGDEDGR